MVLTELVDPAVARTTRSADPIAVWSFTDKIVTTDNRIKITRAYMHDVLFSM